MDWTFFARALPERVPLTFEIPGADVTTRASGVKLKIHGGLADRGQITCRLSVLEGNPDIFFVRNLLDQHLRALIDLFGYQGLAFDLDIISATSQSGETVSFGIGIPGLMEAHGAKAGTHEISGQTVLAAMANDGARVALAQLRNAMREATGTGFFCYQALEAMMQDIRNDNDTDPRAWERFRTSLNIDRSAIDFVKSHADDRRHGRTPDISDAERLKVFLITDKSIERFLQFLTGGNADLDTARFPLLIEAQFQISKK